MKIHFAVANFAHNAVHVHLVNIALNIPTNHCNHCLCYLHDSIHTPLTLLLTYLLRGALTVFSNLFIVLPSLYVSYPMPLEKRNYQLHKSQNYSLKTLLGSSESQKSLFIIVIASLLPNFVVSYGVFLALKPVPRLFFTHRVLVKVNAPNHTFKQILCVHIYDKPLTAWLDALLYTEFAINSITSQSTGYSPFFILYSW